MFAYAVSMVKRHDTTFYKGVYVDGVPLYGVTVEQAYEYIRTRAKNQLADWSITVQYGDRVWSITPDFLQMQLDVADQINKAWQQGHSGNLVEDYTTIMALQASPYYGYTTIHYNEYSLDALMTEIKNTLDVAPVDASVTTDPYKTPPVRYTQEASGRSVDVVALKHQIIEKLDRLEKATITIEPQVLQPAITVAMLQQNYTKIADYRTKISTSSTPERNRNIEIGCERFNG
ncbi:MAG TPA: peptidoglycan binding domain-containing protein, partial [Clostridia bacterium]|nr:peptidoglycan binding domain-containing protein [Clostridia bacterium]